MISNFWKSVKKWQKIFMDVCNKNEAREVNWDWWFKKVCANECGYCKEFVDNDKNDECKNCILVKQKACNDDYYGSAHIYIFHKIRDVCCVDDYDKILCYTWEMLQAVSNPANMKYFTKR